MESWAINLVLAGEFLLLVLLGMGLMAVLRWEATLRDSKAAWIAVLQKNSRKLRDTKRRMLAIEASSIPDAGTWLKPTAILGLFLKWKRSPRA